MSVPAFRTARRALAAVGAALTVAVVPVALAGPASAHVRVDPGGDGTAAPGSYALLTFRVPNESATASTTQVTVDLPTDTPFTSVSVEPVPGWTAQVTTAPLPEPVEVHGASVTEAPASITWTADGEASAIHDGELRRFVVSAGPVPDADQVLLPATQTYSDGTVVTWDEAAGADGAEPEHPAPVLTIAAPAPTPAPTTADDDADAQSAAAAPEPTPGSGSGSASVSGWGAGLGAAGLGLGLVGAVTGVAALARSGRRDGAPAHETAGTDA